MKKWIILLFVTFFMAGAILSFESISKWFIPTVEIIVVKPSDIQQTIQCTGKIVIEGQEDIKLEIPVIIDKVMVKEGEVVEKGQLLFTINKDETISALASLDFMQIDNANLSENTEIIPETINSPTSGIILNIGASNGSVVDANTTLMSISNENGLQIEANISEEMISDVRTGQRAIINGSGFKGREYGGIVSKISSTANQISTGIGAITAIRTIIIIEDADSFLRPGYTANIEIIIDTADNKIVVPYGTVMQDNEGQEYMYVYSGGWVLRRNINSNRETAMGIEVTSGVKAGESVVKTPKNLSGHSLRVNVIRTSEE